MRTKRTWVSFFNEEAKGALMEYLEMRTDDDPRLFPLSLKNCKIFKKAAAETGL